jgi:hypothetical protein
MKCAWLFPSGPTRSLVGKPLWERAASPAGADATAELKALERRLEELIARTARLRRGRGP